MIVVTGGAGLIGSNVIKKLNQVGVNDILVVDNLKNGKKVVNLSNLDITDYIDKLDFLEDIKSNKFNYKVKCVFHLGASTKTTEWDGRYLMKNNYEYSKYVLDWCLKNNSQFIYASSASVYGLAKQGFVESRFYEKPINMYAYSKFFFDEYVRRVSINSNSQIVGLRYFNVYGPNEGHKDSMASPIYHFTKQIFKDNFCKVFGFGEGYKEGEHSRDFIYVEDAAKVNLWFYNNSKISGIYNVGTGKSETFNKVAKNIISWNKIKRNKLAYLEYIPFPESLKGSYQSYTCANLSALVSTGYKENFLSLENGINQYLNWIKKNENFH